jgi:hypothetical protein
MMSSAWLSVLAKIRVLGVSLRAREDLRFHGRFMAWMTCADLALGLTTERSSSLPV